MAKDKKHETHTQCTLRRGNEQTTSWLPTRYANVGKYVKLQDRDTKEWVDGWLVVAAHTTLPTSYVSERSQDFKHQRKASDA